MRLHVSTTRFIAVMTELASGCAPCALKRSIWSGPATDVGPIRKSKFRGKDRVGFQRGLLLTLAGYNRIRMPQYSCRGADMTAKVTACPNGDRNDVAGQNMTATVQRTMQRDKFTARIQLLDTGQPINVATAFSTMLQPHSPESSHFSNTPDATVESSTMINSRSLASRQLSC